MKQQPTFEQLCEHRELSVMNPDNGLHFRVSLRDWESCLWAIRIYPKKWRASYKHDSFVNAHRLMERYRIEQWLTRLRLVRNKNKENYRARRSTAARQP
jgi:hypothetical protein